MANAAENKVTVLSPTDSNVPEFLDFKKLRKEGLGHIGELAGKIWTDHNVHDPGITILEVLIYALMDLGYKANLPFEDLITQKTTSTKDDNFLTPLEILTVNPVTITDYRKLLLEVKGVRNAWLEPADQEVPLFIDAHQNILNCKGFQYSSTQKCNPDRKYPFMEVHLNGIYKVYIEKDTDLVQNKSQHDELVADVTEILAAHRNLCEDFKEEICLLEPLEIGVCAEVRVASGFSPEKIYGQVIKAIREFIQPQIKYYTLYELLDQGKSIDAIFAGRPYRQDSYGFVDTEVLESLERRKEIHLSDLYTVILSVQGVLNVKKMHINGGANLPAPNFCNKRDGETGKWSTGIRIADNEVTVFSLEQTCVDMYSEQGYIPLNKSKIHKGFSFLKKFHLPENELNTQIPSGRHREDLGAYESIQKDFPVVYGIGEDGLPERASLLRKSQALQLKGYLLLYDQMLANYAAQLTHIRSLFALTPEADRASAEKHTYFTQLVETVPGLGDLLKLYGTNGQMDKGARLAIPVARDETWNEALTLLDATPRPRLTVADYCDNDTTHLRILTFRSAALRGIYIDQLVDAFFNEKYTVEVLTDRGGKFFVLCPKLPGDVVFIGLKRFATDNEAYNEAKTMAFLCGLQESYTVVSDLSNSSGTDAHYFNLNYNPLSYVDLVQDLTEDNAEYLERRKQFLDHLLARFGEQFTDYTLLHYQDRMGDTEVDQRSINDQSSYIDQFAEISRNRARAFNYLEPSWNTDNVSGFEKRVSLLAGIENYDRRNLCNFEVSRCFRLQLKDARENVLFNSNRSYDTKEELYRAAEKVLTDLRYSATYDRLDKDLNGFNREEIHRLFSTSPAKENIVVTQNQYHHQLLNADNEIVIFDKKVKLRSEKAALAKKDDFIRRINEQEKEGNATRKYRLLPIDDHKYINSAALDYDIKTLISWKWHIHEVKSNRKVKSDLVFEHENEAWEHVLGKTETQKYLTAHADAMHWKLIIKGNITLRGSHDYPDKNRAVAAWRQAKTMGSDPANYSFDEKEGMVSLNVTNDKGGTVAVSNPIPKEQLESETIVEECVSVFSNRNTKAKYEKSAEKYGFRILDKKDAPVLVSYSSYATEREALEQMGQAFSLGTQKKNYLKSGDEGNPEYNFILRDESDTFLALPSDHLETASDRDKSLNVSLQFLKKNEIPVLIKEEPRRYVWSVSENGKTVLESDSEFPSKAKAQANFDKRIVAEVKKNTSKFLTSHRYAVKIASLPSRYGFIYGTSDEQGRLDPIFKGKTTYTSYDEASTGYTAFAEKLPALNLESVSEKGGGFDFALFEKGKTAPIAIQYRANGKKASFDAAEEMTAYIHEIYTQEGTPRVRFIEEAIAKHPEGKYEWRFYKKNAPIARSPYNCRTKDMAERIKLKICDVDPPVTLKECPPKKKVVCPEKNPDKYHYQVCFKAEEDREFVVISYKGYDSYEEAEIAWESNWLQVIDAARDPDTYLPTGKINLQETYKVPDSMACDDSSFIAVVPEVMTKKLEEKGIVVADYYCAMAHLFPIFQIQNLPNEVCDRKYIYRITLAEAEFINTDCKNTALLPHKGSLLWESTECFDSSAEAIAAYQHFYTLAGIPNNCRVLCEKGNFYVGLLEVMVESLCEYESEEEAWDNAFPNPEDTNECKDCIPRGVREFVYAAEDCKNFIPICDHVYWKFKVVSPSYFVVDHERYYDSEEERNKQLAHWMEVLKELDWDPYISRIHPDSEEGGGGLAADFLNLLTYQTDNDDIQKDHYCDYIERIRNCMASCEKEKNAKEQAEETLRCLRDKFKDNRYIIEFLENERFSPDPKNPEKNVLIEFLRDLAKEIQYYPIHKTEDGYCYRLYVLSDGETITEEGLQPCGCEDEDEVKGRVEIVAFVGSNCYNCCEEAINAFMEFCKLIQNGKLTSECTEKTPYGPYSFTLVDTRKVIGYHPQHYECAQDVFDAIEATKGCVNNTGMHLLEHILLRPKKPAACQDAVIEGENGNDEMVCCMLPICPDYCCDIPFQPDMDKDDPCAEVDPDANFNPNKIYYLPGSDPYSFWATVVLPAWDRRFRTQESRKAFEMLLYKEVSALVGLNIMWLSPRDLCKFEEVYRKWLDWKQNPDAELCDPNGISPNCLLTDCIKHLRTEDPCPSIPGATGECECKPKEEEKNNPYCLPPETEGTLFWGDCPPQQPEGDIPGTPNSPSLNAAVDSAPLKEDYKAKAKEKKAGKKSETKKKSTSKKKLKKTEEKQLLALVRKRNPKYLVNIAEAADEAMLQTKSYERTQFFLKNTPTIHAYGQLVIFFDRYSLHENNNLSGFLILIKNATWHLLDTFVLEKDSDLNKKDLEDLKQSLQKLKAKGLSLKEVRKNWNLEEIEALLNTDTKSRLESILN